jgi:fatty acid desaturase
MAPPAPQQDSVSQSSRPAVEWPTVLLIAAWTVVWLAVTFAIGQFGWWWLIPVLIALVTLHSSLQHEALHGHPTRSRLMNEALVFPAAGLFFPYRRFRALHLRHHDDPRLTDPYEDPESNYFAPEDWERLPGWMQRVRIYNNTLFGRLTFGPLLGVVGFWAAEFKLIVAGEQRVRKAWLLHMVGLVPVLGWLMAVAELNPLVYAMIAAYPGYALLTLRTYAEHRAALAPPERTCVIDDRSGILGFLFLNNNLHAVHHKYPSTAWYRLPALWAAEREATLTRNGGYYFASYGQLLWRYAFHPKEPVPHPLMPVQRHSPGEHAP